MRDECIGIPPRFECEFCPSKFRRKYHLVRHLNARHSDIVGVYGSGIIVNGRDGKKIVSKVEINQQQQLTQQQQDVLQQAQLKVPLSALTVKNENIAMNAANTSPATALPTSAAEFAVNLAKDFSVDAIMQMKREQCDTPTMSGQGLKLIEELQRKIGFQMNSDLFTSLRQMNPLKY